MSESIRLTRTQKNALAQIEGGADVLSYQLSRSLRAVEQRYPTLLKITKARGEYPKSARRPYFGAILTRAGKAALAENKP